MHIFNKIFRFMLRPWVSVGYLILVVISYIYFDKSIATFFHGLHLSNNFVILNWITNLGMSKIYIVILPIFALVAYYFLHNKNLSLKLLSLWSMLVFVVIIATALKIFLGRARPVLWFVKQQFGFFGWHLDSVFHSFPSGHVTTITSLGIGLTILLPRYFAYWAFICLVVILSRILLTYHYCSDVLLSFYLVFLELGLFMYIIGRKFPNICEQILK